MQITGLFHVAIKAASLAATENFYCGVLGLALAPRPPLKVPGIWLQASTSAGDVMIHVYGGDVARNADGTHPVGGNAVDHVALAAHGFNEMKRALAAKGIPFRERPVPGGPLWQLFVYDPNGIQLELNFHSGSEAGPGPDPSNDQKRGVSWYEPQAYAQFGEADR